MARQNTPLLAFNRGIIDTKALARVDLDRTRLSAEVMDNWLPKTQGAMRLRPGTKHFGNSLRDTGAEWIEFVAATDDVALLELTGDTGSGGNMRVWLGSDAHNLSLLGRPKVDTTLTISDTGWEDASTGGVVSTPAGDVIPTMTAPTTNNVEITASSERKGTAIGGDAWRAAEDLSANGWEDTGEGSALPSWLNVDFDAAGTDTGNNQAITSYSILGAGEAQRLDQVPKAWRLLANDHDTGVNATDTGQWTLVDERTAETGWSVNETRAYTRADADTGTVEAHRHWRLYFTKVDNDGSDTGALSVFEMEMFTANAAQQVKLQGGSRVLNASAIGSLARLRKQVVVDTGDLNLEHSLDIKVDRGPVVCRVGSSQGDDDYVSETFLGTGYHNLAFTPTGNFHITLQNDKLIDRTVSRCSIGDSGTVEITTHLDANDLANVRYDQSADVVYVDASGAEPHKVERRGTGRSWSWVEYHPDNGPFRAAASSTAKLSINQKYGNAELKSDIPFFTASHVAGSSQALFRLFNNGQSGTWPLGAKDAATDAIEVTGISDTGTASADSERRIVISGSGTWGGTLTIERSFDGPAVGFKKLTTQLDTGGATDTGTFTTTIDDPDDNVSVWYRGKLTSHDTGVVLVDITYNGGGTNGICRAVSFNSNTSMDVEILSRFSDTGKTDSWQEGAWSGVVGFPSTVKLHGGRLFHSGGANLWGSVSDDYENFDDAVTGDAGPIIRTLGSGPVDNVYYLVSLLRLIVGTTGSEITIRSSSIDEPLTPTNANARAFSTQGSANLRALQIDQSAIFVQRSNQRVFQIGFGEVNAFGDYSVQELTMLVPDLLKEGVVSIAVQRQPDTRIHCVLGDGTVAILTYEPQEDVLCWSKWSTDGSVERAMVLPGTVEDAVYYHVNRTINGATKRFLEKWALESECEGDTGLTFLVDCAASYTDTGRVTTAAVWTHLEGASVVAWGDDTGQVDAGRDLSPDDTGGDPMTYTVSSGAIDISSTYAQGVHHLVAGLPYTADYRTAKLAYAAQFGTALAQRKRVPQMAVLLTQTHNKGLLFGSDTGHLDNLPGDHLGETVGADKIFTTYDQPAFPFPGTYDSDSRVHLRARSPRPATVLAIVPTIETSEK